MSGVVTATVKHMRFSDEDPFGGSERWEHNAWQVTLRYDGRRMSTAFYTGRALDEPTARDVLESLLSDAATVENAEGFEDWAADLGYDPDSRKAEGIYAKTVAQTGKLRDLLGDVYDWAVFPPTGDPETVLDILTGQLSARW